MTNTNTSRAAWTLTKSAIWACWLTFGAVWIITHPTFLEPATGILRIVLVGVLLLCALAFAADLYSAARQRLTRRRGRAVAQS